MPNYSFHSRNSLFLRLSKAREDGSWSQCYKTEVVTKNKAPHFKNIMGPVLQLTNGDFERPLKVEVWNYMPGGKHILMGECETTLQVGHFAICRPVLGNRPPRRWF